MPRPRPPGGSRAGIPNKTTAEVKQALEYAFEKIGGQQKLAEWAQSKPELFYPLWSKLLPKDVKVEHSGQVDIMLKTAKELEERLRGPAQPKSPPSS